MLQYIFRKGNICGFNDDNESRRIDGTGRSVYLPSAIAAQSLQMLPVSKVARQPATLQRDARVNERRGTTVVVHKKRLRNREKKKTEEVQCVLPNIYLK